MGQCGPIGSNGILGSKWARIYAKQFMSKIKLLPRPYTEKLGLFIDFRHYISSQATQSFVGNMSRAKSVCAMLNVGVKLNDLSRYGDLCLVNMVLQSQCANLIVFKFPAR